MWIELCPSLDTQKLGGLNCRTLDIMELITRNKKIVLLHYNDKGNKIQFERELSMVLFNRYILAMKI